MLLTQQLVEYIRACFTDIWVESHEYEDVLAELARPHETALSKLHSRFTEERS